MLEKMILDYKTQGSRVDEVLFKEVMKVVERSNQNKCYREAVKMSMDYLQDGRSPRANELYQHLHGVLEGLR